MTLDQDFCLIINDYGAYGLAFPETGLASASFDAVVRDIFSAQIEGAVAVIEFNPVEGHARDVTEDVARKVAELVNRDAESPSQCVRRFLDRQGLGYPKQDRALV